MDISSTASSNSLRLSLPSADLHQAIALKMLKQAIDMQGQLALQLLPETTPKVDPSSPLGQNIDIRV